MAISFKSYLRWCITPLIIFLKKSKNVSFSGSISYSSSLLRSTYFYKPALFIWFCVTTLQAVTWAGAAWQIPRRRNSAERQYARYCALGQGCKDPKPLRPIVVCSLWSRQDPVIKVSNPERWSLCLLPLDKSTVIKV